MEGTKYASRKLMIAFLCLVEMFLALGLIFGFSVMYADLTIVFNLTRLKSATIQGVYNLISLGGGIHTFYLKIFLSRNELRLNTSNQRHR